MPSVTARAMSAALARAATSLGRMTAIRRWPRLRRTRPAACRALRSRTMSSCSDLPTPTRTVHLLGTVLRLWTGTSSMNLPRNSRSASSWLIAPFSFLSRLSASGGSFDCPSKIGKMSASASAFSGAVVSSRACIRPPRPLAKPPYCTCRAYRGCEPRLRACRSWKRRSISLMSASVYRFRPSSSCRLAVTMPSRIAVAIVAGETPSFSAASVIEYNRSAAIVQCLSRGGRPPQAGQRLTRQLDRLGILHAGHIEDQPVEPGGEEFLRLLRHPVGASGDEAAADSLLVDSRQVQHLLEESLGFRVALADDQAAQPRLYDRVRIPSDLLTVPLQDIELVADHGRVAKDVRHVGVLRHQLEGALLATTADHDRRAIGLDGPREIERALDLVVTPLERRRFFTEHRPTDL